MSANPLSTNSTVDKMLKLHAGYTINMHLYGVHLFVFLVICNIKVMTPVLRGVTNASATRAKGSIDKISFHVTFISVLP